MANQWPVSIEASTLTIESSASPISTAGSEVRGSVAPFARPLLRGANELAGHRLEPFHDRLGQVRRQPCSEGDEGRQPQEGAPAGSALGPSASM